MRPRVTRYTASGLRTSLLSVPGAVGAEAVGLRPIGEVMGCVVEHSGRPGLDDLVSSMRRGYGTALDRLRAEACALGADGVLAIGCTVTPSGRAAREFVVLGTAVRARRGKRPGRTFTSVLPGPDVAKLLLAGWVPVTVAIGVDGGTAYDVAMEDRAAADRATEDRDRPGRESAAPTELVTRVRAAARAEFRQAVHESGADGGLVARTTLRAWAHGPTGAAAVASVFGTAIARFTDGPAPTASRSVLPLDGDHPGRGR